MFGIKERGAIFGEETKLVVVANVVTTMIGCKNEREISFNVRNMENVLKKNGRVRIENTNSDGFRTSNRHCGFVSQGDSLTRLSRRIEKE